MSFIEWDPAWSVGNALIDYDHQMLVQITNEVMDMRLRPGVQNKDIKCMLDRLVDYTKYHFAREETMFGETDYPDAAAHKAMHRQLEKTLIDIVALYDREGDALNLDEICRFLRVWLTNHIAKHDNGYAPYLA